MPSFNQALHGHVWTLGPHLKDNIRRPRAAARHFEVQVPDELHGSVRLTGLIDDKPGSGGMLVVVHGLGGHAESIYAIRMARAARRLGLSCLRLNLRGADRKGEDYYHAGLSVDLHRVLEAPEVTRHQHVWIAGYSLGGHMTLRAAAEGFEPRVRAVAAVCAPVDLALSQIAIDSPRRWIYRQHVLSGLKAMYSEVAEKRPVPIAPREAQKIRTIRDWDERIIARRHGFGDAADYYEKMSAGPVLDRIRTPTLFVAAEHDPMVPAHTVRPSLQSASSAVDVRWLDRGGHVGFPSDIDLGLSSGEGLEAELCRWLTAHR